jgi:DNA-directed RNA polymerase subunit alpha
MYVNKENLNIDTAKESKNFGTYELHPLPTGFGHTLGNSLRRVLLTSIPGAAITSVKFAGASHQFTNLKGVKEDVVELTMNLKKIRLKVHSDNPVVAVIKKKGSGKITAGDIEVPADAEILNKTQHIATLADKNTTFEAELIIEAGIGYSPMEERQSSKVGVIVLDALYSPIRNVTYSVDPTRHGERADLDMLSISIETDGSISPRDALNKSAKLLKGFFETVVAGGGTMTEEEEKEESPLDTIKAENVAIEELPLQTRTINALKKHGVNTLHELAEKTDEEISDIKNLGEKSLTEIKKLLKKEGLRE